MHNILKTEYRLQVYLFHARISSKMSVQNQPGIFATQVIIKKMFSPSIHLSGGYAILPF